MRLSGGWDTDLERRNRDRLLRLSEGEIPVQGEGRIETGSGVIILYNIKRG